MHRLRAAMGQAEGLLSGTVEVDEAFFGGLEKNKHAKKKLHENWTSDKQAVVGFRERGGPTKIFLVDDTSSETLHPLIHQNVQLGTTLYTDGYRGYNKIYGYFRGTVEHCRGQYVDGDAHTNSIESFWALLKRAYKGVFHYMSPKHLQRYLDEFAERRDTLDLSIQECVERLARQMVGVRLTYQALVHPGECPLIAH